MGPTSTTSTSHYQQHASHSYTTPHSYGNQPTASSHSYHNQQTHPTSHYGSNQSVPQHSSHLSSHHYATPSHSTNHSHLLLSAANINALMTNPLGLYGSTSNAASQQNNGSIS